MSGRDTGVINIHYTECGCGRELGEEELIDVSAVVQDEARRRSLFTLFTYLMVVNKQPTSAGFVYFWKILRPQSPPSLNIGMNYANETFFQFHLSPFTLLLSVVSRKKKRV